MNEKRIRDAAVLGALHGIVFEDEVEQPTNAPPRFDGGVRGDVCNAPRHVEPSWGRARTWGRLGASTRSRTMLIGQLGER